MDGEARLKLEFGKYFLKANALRTRSGTELNYILPLEAFNKL